MKRKLFITAFLLIALFSQAQEVSSDTVKYFYESGELSSIGILKDGKPDGYWKSFYINGNVKTEGNRKDFLLDGPWKFYSLEGKLTLIINYKEDLKSGFRETYDGEGVLLKKENFENNAKEGYSYTYFKEDGKLKTKIPFKNNREEGTGFEYNKEKTIVTIFKYKSGILTKEQFINRFDENGLKKATWMRFYDNMQVQEEGMYVKDLKHGFWKYYKRDGNLLRIERWVMGVLMPEDDITGKIEIKRIKNDQGRIVSSGPFRNGKKDGIHQFYNENGKVDGAKIYEANILLAEGNYDDQGRKQGEWKYYFGDGELKEKGNYKDDLKTGKWNYYFIDGKIEQTGSYLKDKPVGSWLWYFPNNEIRKEEEYANGLEDGMSIEYNDTGAVVAKGEYIDGFKEGKWIYTSENIIESGKYYEGEKNGEWESKYKDDGKIFFKGNFINNNPDGVHLYYHPNGVLKRKEIYSNGIKEGTWEYVNEQNEIYLTIEYKNGKEIKYNGVKISYGKRVDRELEAEE